MTDNSSTPVDLRIKRKRTDIDEERLSTKKKSRYHDNEIPLDLSVKSNHYHHHASLYPISSPTIPLYNPTNLFFNSSTLLYDLFLANLNSYYQQQQQQQEQRLKVDSKSSKQQQSIPSSRLIKDNSTIGKHESYACSCGERYSNVAQLVSHLKITNHHAQLSSTHDEVAKLVRGQDIWLSRDTNPANQILKCLRCSLSFETLPDLTAHMMKTNHFTQLLPSSSSSSSSNSLQHSNSKQHSPTKFPQLVMNQQSRSTCLVCSQQFAREVDLVDHLQRLHQIRFNCTTCGMYFENENIYKDHLLKEMHHRNGKTNRNRDYLSNQLKSTAKQQTILSTKSQPPKSQSPIDKEVERVTSDLLDRIDSNDETTTTATNNNALSLLQNFVIKQTPSTATITLLDPVNRSQQIDLNNNCNDDDDDDENSNQTMTNSSEEKSSPNPIKLHESPLASLEKMLAYPTSTFESSSTSTNDHGPKRKKFDKYRLFAEKMLRSTLS